MEDAVLKAQEENIALVQQIYSTFAAQDITALLELLAHDIDWLFFGPAEIPFAGHYRGHEEVATFFARAFASCEFLRFEAREFLPGVQSVLVQGFEEVRAKSTGRIWETEWAHVFTIAGGQILKMREYYDTAVMVEAFRSE